MAFYNRERPHSYCDDLTPDDAEQLHYAHPQSGGGTHNLSSPETPGRIISTVFGVPYWVILDAVLAGTGYLDTPPTGDIVTLDDVVALAQIIAEVTERALSPTESSHLRTAFASVPAGIPVAHDGSACDDGGERGLC